MEKKDKIKKKVIQIKESKYENQKFFFFKKFTLMKKGNLLNPNFISKL